MRLVRKLVTLNHTRIFPFDQIWLSGYSIGFNCGQYRVYTRLSTYYCGIMAE